MRKRLLLSLSTAVLFAAASLTAYAQGPIKTEDGLLEITLPDGAWYQITSEENTEMFSDGDCAILVNLYKNGEKLPAIESADKNHELIYTAAASTQEYILHVVGYAHEQEDFSGICKAINTIKVDNAKITDSMLNHSITVDNYQIVEMNYSAWVACDGLNVRSTTEDGTIITTLEYGDKVTVTGSVVHNGVEIGWARVTTASGTEGYVSMQFLSDTATGKDTEPEKEETAEKTGTTCVLYSEIDGECTLYRYTDGTWRTEDGTVFWRTTSGNYVDANGNVLFVNGPDEEIYRLGNSYTVYDNYGTPIMIYQYSDNYFYDDSFNRYEKIWCSEEWMVNGSEDVTVSMIDPTAGIYDDDTEYGSTEFAVVDDYGNVKYISYTVELEMYFDEDGNAYDRYNPWGAYIDSNGVIYHTM